MSSYQTIEIERTGNVALVTLNRPKSLNAFDTGMRREFIKAAREVNNDETIRVVVLTGAGRGFSAGADLAEKVSAEDTTGQATEDYLNADYKPGLLAVRDAKKPWISAVNGPAAGIGSAYALACDIVVMADDAYFYQAFAAIGLIPDGGATWHLARILGRQRAYEMIVSGEKIRAERCLELGLCNRVVPAGELVEQAIVQAETLAGKAPLALRYAKESLNFALEHTLGEVISNEARLQHTCIDSEDAKEGIRAFMGKRDPVWKGQ